MTDEEKEKREDEYKKLLALFLALLRNLHNEQMIESLYMLSAQRAEYIIIHALDGFGMTVEDAVQLLKSRNDNTLTQFDRDRIDRIVAAVDNLIEFAVAEEYQLWLKTNEIAEDDDIDDDTPLFSEAISMCEKYNKTYALVEDEDARYSMAMAAWWISVSRNEYLIYMTQGDDRVRPWHAALEGFTARRDEFPSWMIPPIEWGCRCFLLTMSGDYVANSVDLRNVVAEMPEKPAQFDATFNDSICKCGRIFGEAHPYFKIKEEHLSMLEGFVERIKEQWYGRY